MAKRNYTQDIIDKIIELHLQGLSSRKICDQLGWERSKKSGVNRVLGGWRGGEIDYSKSGLSLKNNLPRVLLFDIETAPNKFHGWGMFNQNFGLNQLVNEWFVLSYAAKWLGEDEVLYEDMRGKVSTEDDTHLLDSLWKLFNEADIIIGQNSKSFDVKKLNARWIMNGYQPPSPYKQIDTLDIAKRKFAFTSRKLEHMTNLLCDNKKLTHGKFAGFELWRECMIDNPEAWEEMEDYNRMDVISLEELYLKMAAWDDKHVNFNLYSDTTQQVCRCGSTYLKEDGFAYTGVSKFQQYRCLGCGATTRGRINLFSKEKRASLHMNIS